MADWLTGMLTGYADRSREIEREKLLAAHDAAQREGDIFKMMLGHSDPKIRALAGTGLIANAQPQTRKKGLAGWMGEMETNPVYPQLLKYLDTPQLREYDEVTPGLPSTKVDVSPLPMPTPPQSMVAAPPPAPDQPLAQAATSAVEPGSPGLAPVTPPPEPPLPAWSALAPDQSWPTLGPSYAGARVPGFMQDQGVVAPTSPEAAAPPAAAPTLGGAPGPPPAPPGPATITRTPQPGPRVGRVDTRQDYVKPEAFPTPSELKVQQSQADVQGEIAGWQEMFRQAGEPDWQQKGIQAVLAQKQRAGSRLLRGDIRPATPADVGHEPGTYVRDLMDAQTGQVVETVPAMSPGLTGQVTSKDQIAFRRFGNQGEDPKAVLRRITPKQMGMVIEEERNEKAITAAEIALRRAEAMANAPLTTQARSALTETLNQKWTTLQKPLREMQRALSTMETGVSRYRQDPNGASQAVLITFQKMLDPDSVVRETEYDRSAQGLSLISRAKGFWEKYYGQFDPATGKWTGGGAGVPEVDLREMAETARQFLAGLQNFNGDERQRIEDRATQNGIDPGYIFGGGVQPGANAPRVATPPPTQPGLTAPPTGYQMINGVLYKDGKPL